MKTSEKTSAWTVYNMSFAEFVEKLGLAPDTDYVSVSARFDGVQITTTRKGQQ